MFLLPDKLINRFRAAGQEKFRLRDYVTELPAERIAKELGPEAIADKGEKLLETSRQRLSKAQELLYAADSYAVLLIFQALDAAGKDGTIKHVMSGVNPQGCQVTSFKQPSHLELDHDFLWRCNAALPERGRIGIFNRSYYEEVLVVRVHPELLANQKLPPPAQGQKPSSGKREESFWRERYDSINNFERHLTNNGTVILKFFLYLSKSEQKRRFLERLDEPHKNWKFSAGDLVERGRWDDYLSAYEKAIAATSSEYAPWYVIPADTKWLMRVLVADIVASTIHGLNLSYPQLTPAELAKFAEYRQQLLSEPE
ncbi:MAG: polyphosphate kinase 2 family protein [Pirellulales bacterium]|nr:polyphosphate kinase 2 family protein [Pirellulales bacterium]